MASWSHLLKSQPRRNERWRGQAKTSCRSWVMIVRMTSNWTRSLLPIVLIAGNNQIQINTARYRLFLYCVIYLCKENANLVFLLFAYCIAVYFFISSRSFSTVHNLTQWKWTTRSYYSSVRLIRQTRFVFCLFLNKRYTKKNPDVSNDPCKRSCKPEAPREKLHVPYPIID